MNNLKFAFIILLLFIFHASGSDHPIYISDSDAFRPVYSTSLTGNVSPDHPLRINTEIRDSETGFIRVFAWGENGTNWNLKGDVGTEPYIVFDPIGMNSTEYPKVLTLRNFTNEYLVLDPAMYPLLVESNESSGIAEVTVLYVYHEHIDMGDIQNKTYSVWETTIPDGLETVLFMTESVYGTDLNLFIEKGNTMPSSFTEFTYNSTSNCTTCWDSGIENYLAELYILENPEPGPYLMVTKADGGDDFFYTYWIGIEKKDKEKKENHHSL